jgi:hypothetical protein
VPSVAFLDFSPAPLGPLLFLAGGLLSGVRKWRRAPAPPPSSLPYEVACACGQRATGLRQPGHQVVRCARCGEPLFILPCSRLPPVRPPGKRSRPAASAPRARPRLRLWGPPVLAGALTVLGLVVAYRFVIAPRVPARLAPAEAARDAAQATAASVAAFAHTAGAREQLARGSFRLALRDLHAARALIEPLDWPRARREELARLERQAGLLADLLAEPLEDVLGHAAGVQDAEWELEFGRRYRGRAVVFDLEVHAGPAGRYEHGWLLRARGQPAHLELGDLELLRRLPLDRPRRLLFGARLESVGREPGRGWVVRLRPDSGVLITDPEAAAACFLAPEDPQVRALLARQAEWAARP